MKKKSSARSAFFNLRALVGVLLCFAGAMLAFVAFSKSWAQPNNDSVGAKQAAAGVQYRGLLPVVNFALSPPLREMKPLPVGQGKLRDNEDRDIVPRIAGIPKQDPIAQRTIGTPLIGPPLVSFNGPANTSGVSPPDPNGDVGPNHIVVMANLSFQIFNKTGTSLFGPAANNTLWAALGGACAAQNAGDPVVLYDQQADRWLLTQFTSSAPFLECVALSQTSDPTGAYYLFGISTGSNFPDYPKAGVWPDAYYFSTREFSGGSGGPFAGVGAYALNRAQFLAGNPNPQVVSFLVPPAGGGFNVGDGLLPSDLDGATPPPAGSPNYFLGSQDNNGPYGSPSDALNLYKFHVDFGTPANSTFTGPVIIPTSSFNSILGICSGGRACIPQPSTTNRIDHLGYRQRPLHRLAYRNYGDHESLVTNQSVSAGTGPSGEVSGIRWWELRSPNTTPVIFQEGTYAPGLTDGIHRWMGSICMDGMGNTALAYSSGDATHFPSVSYTARNAGSPPGQMPLGEGAIVTGTGSQTGSNRWGDYTSISIDPVDDTTFWVVNEWVPATSSIGWQLRIGSFKLIPAPSLGGNGSTLTAESCTPPNMVLDPNETVTISFCVKNNGDAATTNAMGTLQASGGVTNPSGPQNYGAIAPGATVCKSFTFTVNTTCGGTVTASIQLQDGATNLGTLTYNFQTGTLNTSFTENFDGVVAPALPAGWTADQGTNTAGAPLWVTSNAGTPAPPADSAPNATFSQDPANLCDNRLYSSTIMYTAGSQLIFRQNFDLEEASATQAYDAGVLEISVNGGAYQDIVTAGGSFASGGYNHTSLNTGFANPLLADHCPAGNCANWAGVSGGFMTTAVNLPAANAGQPVKFRWRMGSDNSVSHTGWRVDNVSIAQRVCSTNCAPLIASAVSRKAHTGSGNFDIDLPQSGPAGVEDRTGGATNDFTVVVTFGSNIAVTGSPQAEVIAGTGTIGSGGVSNGGAVTVAANVVTIPLTNVADQQTINVRLNGVNSAADAITADVTIPMSRLLGDVDGNRTVNASDITKTKARVGQPLSSTNFRADIDESGGISSTDVSIIKSNTGHAVP